MNRTSYDSLEGITSLAILKVNWDEREKDYLENFMPFVAECLRKVEADEVSLPTIRSVLSESIGFDIPSSVVKTLLRRAHRRNYVSIINGVYYRDLDKLGPSNFEQRANALQRESRALIAQLQSFARERFEIVMNEEEADSALLEHVRCVAAPLVTAARRGRAVEVDEANTAHLTYVLSAFILHLHERDPQGFKYLENVAKGSMLASVLYYENANATTQKFQGVRVYFDTPLLLCALGINGPEIQAPFLELFSLLQAQSVQLSVFRHTVDEMQRVLDASARRPRAERAVRVPTSTEPIQSTLRPSDLRLIADTLLDKLNRLDISVENRPDFDLRYSLNEGKLDEILQKRINYARDEARIHDVDALMAIHRLRRGRVPARLEESTAIFVTTNTSLARVSREFFTDQLGPRATDAPNCIVYDELATRLWLKTPNSAPDLPRRQLIAHSYAALLPEEGLLDKYIAEIERLRKNEALTGDEYLYMRSADEAFRALADVTLNDPDAFSEATIEEVRRRATEEARAADRARIQQEEAARRIAEQEAEEARTQLEAAVARFEAEEAARKEKEAEVAAHREIAHTAERKANAEAVSRAKTVEHVRGIAGKNAQIVRVSLRALFVVFLVAAIVISVLYGIPEEEGGWTLFAIVVAVGLLSIQQLISALKDASSWAEKFAQRVEQRTLRRLLPPDLHPDGTISSPHLTGTQTDAPVRTTTDHTDAETDSNRN